MFHRIKMFPTKHSSAFNFLTVVMVISLLKPSLSSAEDSPDDSVKKSWKFLLSPSWKEDKASTSFGHKEDQISFDGDADDDEHNYYTDLFQEIRPHRGPEWFLVPLIFGIIFVVGTTGNGCLIFTVLRYKEMRTAPNYLLVSLATGDLLLILISVPFSSTIYTFDEWPYGEFVCKLNEFLVAFSLGVTVFTLTALSWERYSVIVHPILASKRRPAFKTMAVVGVVWALAAVLAILELFSAHVSYDYYDYEIIGDDNNSSILEDLSTVTTYNSTNNEFLLQQKLFNRQYLKQQHQQQHQQQQQHLFQSLVTSQQQHFPKQTQRQNPLSKPVSQSSHVSNINPATSAPAALTTEVLQFQETVHLVSARCDSHPKTWPSWYGRFHAMFKFLVYFALPLLIISIFYAIMAKVLFASGRYLEIDASGKLGTDFQSRRETVFTNESDNASKDMEIGDIRGKRFAGGSTEAEASTKSGRKSRISVQLPVEGSKEGGVHCKRNRQPMSISHMTKQIETRKKVARLVLSFVLVFAVCWLPRHMYSLWYRFDDGRYNMFWHVFKIGGFCLSFINSCINPLAVHFLSHQFRRYYVRYFHFFCRCFSPARRDEGRCLGCDNDPWKKADSHQRKTSLEKMKMLEIGGNQADGSSKLRNKMKTHGEKEDDDDDGVIICFRHRRRRQQTSINLADQSKVVVAGNQGPVDKATNRTSLTYTRVQTVSSACC